ncbi:UDP-glucuronosyltransferase 2B2 [Papilio xuthus]|uniref:UDP-glucuronosyltransferase 2B2 n=2 Tax=Papilio xuthus TaxID=66420 RepID=A0A194PZN6_PAPXU|nr:UDP-glucuronosyltransferase 2B2 [Papilio xuthus]
MGLRGKSLIKFEESKYFGAQILVYLNVLPHEAKKWPRKFKPIAGYHIDRQVEPLPKDLQSIMDNAKYGVIYFSMGSNLNSQDILDGYNEILMEVFSNLRQVVLWKHDLKFSHLPSNVHVLKWAPQQTHPNCILFMTQGGALSSIEALHFGVAILGIPIIADQFTNIERAVDQGYAKQVDFPYSTGEDIRDTIEEMIRNPRFRNKVKELSRKYHNQSSPGTDLVRYVRKVIRAGITKYSSMMIFSYEIECQITHIAMFPFNYSHPNLHQIDASWNEKYTRGNDLQFYSQISSKIFTATLQHKDVDKLFRDTTQRFDLIIAEWMFNDICIGFDKESFNKIFEPLMALRGQPLRPYVELMYYSSLVLVYSRVLLGDVTRWPENFKPVAGYHIDQKVKPLPKDLKSIMDNAKYGVIYFSLGSHLKSKDLPEEFKQEIINMLRELKQTVLWKLESEYPDLPNNVHIMKWAPQQSILAHQNCVLFITQGGILSLTEAIYFGVPIIGIPIFADQFTNVDRAVKEGYGKKVDFSTKETVKSIKDAIEEMLHNPRLAALYDCPLIWFFTTEPHWMLLRTINKDTTTPNLVKDIYERGAYKKVFSPLMALRGKSFRNYEDMMSIASLVFMNSHQGLSKADFWPEKFIPVAGYHIDEDIKPLPNDLKIIMDNAKFGVIYFSLGSYLDGHDISEEQMDDLIDMFGELKQTVIWNLDLTFVRLPSNIHVINWAPQQSILAHPNCILFITHGGVISKIEAVHFGVPTIGIPVYGDQFANVDSSVMKGISIKVNVSGFLARDIKNAIVEMLSNPSYRQNIRKVSSSFHNRTMSPKEGLLHWVNQTIRSGVPEVLKPGRAAIFKEIFVSILVILLILSTIFGKQILDGSQKYKIL